MVAFLLTMSDRPVYFNHLVTVDRPTVVELIIPPNVVKCTFSKCKISFEQHKTLLVTLKLAHSIW